MRVVYERDESAWKSQVNMVVFMQKVRTRRACQSAELFIGPYPTGKWLADPTSDLESQSK